ncbi:MAG: tetratricopeptide repeat protein [Candidatus Zixiibacteriota bacterium]
MSMISITVIAGAIIVMGVPAVYGKGYVDAVRKGNEAYTKGDYKTALEQYHVAEADLPESPELEYNMAGALYQQNSYEEAEDKYTKALNSDDLETKAKANYNLGNTYYRSGDYTKAIYSYKKALEINPDDMDAKFNLEMARKMLKEQTKPQQQNQQQQQQQQQQQKQQDQQKQQESPPEQQQNKDQDQQENQDSLQNQPPDESQQQEPQGQAQEQQGKGKQPQMQEQQMSKEDAARILNSLRDDERELQRRLKRDHKRSDYNGKDW